MRPTHAGQEVTVDPRYLDETELSLDVVYTVRHVQTYDDDQPTKVFIDGQSEAMYGDWVFIVVENQT